MKIKERIDIMMHMLRKWYYDNKERIWTVGIIIVLIFFFTNILNNYYKNQPQKSKTSETTNVSTKENINNEIEGELESTKSLITGESISKEQLYKDITIIDKFMNNCIDGKIEEAYELLADECKENNFMTLDVFKTKYYDQVFDSPKTYIVQNWSGNTYKIMIIDDIITTGKVNSNKGYFQDYITVCSSNNEKININRYIGRTTKNTVNSKNGLEITYIKKETYLEYEKYTIKVKNLTTNDITLDSGISTQNIYLLDNNNIKQYANTAKINYSDLLLKPGAIKEYTFEFSNSYSSSRNMEYLIFENVIINHDGNEKIEKISINL